MRVPSRVITIFSTKGGVGKTVITANLAATLVHHLHRPTVLLELDQATADAAALVSRSDVRVNSKRLTVETISTVLTDLRKAYDYVCIDGGSAITKLSLAAFERSNLILLVATPDVASIRHAVKTIEVLTSVGFPDRMIKVVLNRADSRGGYRSLEVRESLPVEVIAEIPSDGKTVGLAMNQGQPFVLTEQQARITDAMKQLAGMLHGDPKLFIEQLRLKPERVAAVAADIAQGIEPAAARSELPAPGEGEPPTDPVLALKHRIHAQLVEQLDLKRLDLRPNLDPKKAKELRDRIETAILELMGKEGGFIPDQAERSRFIKDIIDEAVGLGPLEELIADEEVSDILVNGPEMIYVEKHGKLSLTDKKFISNDQLLNVIERIIAPLGRRIDESNPVVDARLPDGSRVNAIIPPLSLKGPMLSIRKFGRERFTIEDMITHGTLTRAMAEFLRVCVVARKNIIVSGGTGSGKTTMLNALSAFIPSGDRIVTIEDAAELRIVQQDWVPLEGRMANVEGRGGVTIRQLFHNALRMRPDRIIIGECRGDETFDMLQAMNTGHDGSLTTLHANSPQDVVARLDSLVLMSSVDLPVRAIHEQIASAVHLLVHTARFSDGSRRVTHITEIRGMDESARMQFGDIFLFRQEGLDPHGRVLGAFHAVSPPSFLPELRAKGIPIDEALFRA